MASNALNPFGFSSGLLYGAASPNYAMRNGQIAYNYGSQIAYGDPVVLNSSGQIVLFAKGGTAIHGIFRGCEYYDPNIQRWSWYPAWRSPTLSATAIVTAKIEVDPHMSFMAQVSGGPAVQAAIGQNIDIVSASSGAPTLAGMSVCALDYTTLATTATLPFRIVGIQQLGTGTVQQYNPANANNLVEVVMNTSDISTTTGV